ncbi:MAG: hypothetical protein RL112_475 [Planctomycetota bacterium]|jgi:hypothetical protein
MDANAGQGARPAPDDPPPTWLDVLSLADGRRLAPTLRPVPPPGAQFVSLHEGTFVAFEPRSDAPKPPWGAAQMPDHSLVARPLPTTRDEGARLVDLAFLGADGPWPSGWRLSDLRAGIPDALGEVERVHAWARSAALDVWCDAALEVARLQAAQRARLPPEAAGETSGLWVRERFDMQVHLESILAALGEVERARDEAISSGLAQHGGIDRPGDRARVLALRVLAIESTHIHQGHPFAHHACGVAARLAGEWPEAAARFRFVVRRAPTLEAGWLELTWALAMLRDLDGALSSAQRALEHADSAAAWSNLAAVRMERGEKDQARAALDKALARDAQVDWKLRSLDQQWRQRFGGSTPGA